MTIIETRQMQRPSLSKTSLERAKAEYRQLDVEQQTALCDLRNSGYRARGPLLAYLDLIMEEMKKSNWTNRQLGDAVVVSEQAVSLWFKVGEIDARHLTRILSHEVFGIERAPTACDCDVHSYRWAIGWIRRMIFKVKTTPTHVPDWQEFVLLSALHSRDVALEEANVRDFPEALQPYFRGWDRRSKSQPGTRISKILDKWGASYRLFVLEEYYHGKSG